jgi:hypothetical protein
MRITNDKMRSLAFKFSIKWLIQGNMFQCSINHIKYLRSQGNKQWIWLALDVTTREIVGVYIGDRSEQGAKGL